jgi:hypothetical protein
VLTRRAHQRNALVVADLGEDVGGLVHVGWGG